MNSKPFDVVHHKHRHHVDTERGQHVDLVEHETVTEEPDTDRQHPVTVEETNFEELVRLGLVTDQVEDKAISEVAEVCDVVMPPLAVVVAHSYEDHPWHQDAVVLIKEVMRVFAD